VTEIWHLISMSKFSIIMQVYASSLRNAVASRSNVIRACETCEINSAIVKSLLVRLVRANNKKGRTLGTLVPLRSAVTEGRVLPERCS
jgi:hypothetical protein